MKFPKKTKRYCPHCNKRTEQKISQVKQGGRSAAHPQSRWSTARVRLRGLRRGYGNLGRFSKPAIKSWKRKTKATKKANIMFTCSVCKKSTVTKKGIRTSKLQIEDKDVDKKEKREASFGGQNKK